MTTEPMENNYLPGNPLLNGILLTIAWFFAWIDLKAVPVILSSLASLLVIVNQGVTLYKSRKEKKGRAKK
jgi:hypothetical protein